MPEISDYRWTNDEGIEMCSCEYYDEPHESDTGECWTCRTCEFPGGHCQCPNEDYWFDIGR